jgi:lysophospholipase L1-like esterase
MLAPQPLALGSVTSDRLALHIPGAHIRYARSEFDHVIEINSLGLRDGEVSVEKPVGVFRILLLGDSYVEGKQVASEDLFSERLEEQLAKDRPERRWEVVNAGVSGYGTADEVKFFELYGRQLRPDLVILAFTMGNDIRDNLTSPFFRWRHGRLVEVKVPPLSRGERLAARVKELLTSRFHLVQFLRDRVHELEGRGERTAAEELQAHRERLLAPSAQPEIDRAWALTTALLDRLRHDVARTGAALMIVVIPFRAQVEEASPVFDEPQQRLARWARQRSVPLVDLLPALRREGARTYYRIDAHFDARGHQVAAREIYRALVDRRLLPMA